MAETIEELAKAITANLSRIPLDKTLWTRDQCADYLRVAPGTMVETAALPDFPKPTRVTAATGGKGPSNLRWFAGDVIDWARARQG